MSGLILLGPPGAGKGTVAAHLQEALGVPVVSTGHLLRQAIAAKTALGLAAQSAMDQGQLVSDAVVIGLVKAFLAQPDCQHGFLFDGFPRTVVQAESMVQANIDVQLVCCLQVPDAVIVARMSGRRVHAPSGRVYHIEHAPPQRDGLDDVTGEPLTQRADDHPDVVLDRLRIYHQQTEPVVAFFQALSAQSSMRFVTVDAAQPLTKVLVDVMDAAQSFSAD